MAVSHPHDALVARLVVPRARGRCSRQEGASGPRRWSTGLVERTDQAQGQALGTWDLYTHGERGRQA